jgi:hypothetical protein
VQSSVRLDRENGVNGLEADVLSGEKRTVERRRSTGTGEQKTLQRDLKLIRVT